MANLILVPNTGSKDLQTVENRKDQDREAAMQRIMNSLVGEQLAQLDRYSK